MEPERKKKSLFSAPLQRYCICCIEMQGQTGYTGDFGIFALLFAPLRRYLYINKIKEGKDD
jgi:hypothetical protein